MNYYEVLPRYWNLMQRVHETPWQPITLTDGRVPFGTSGVTIAVCPCGSGKTPRTGSHPLGFLYGCDDCAFKTPPTPLMSGRIPDYVPGG